MSHEHEHDHEYMHEHGIPHEHHGHEGGEGHVHSHEHTHADGTTHTHEHDHPHTHEHPACPGAANCSSNCNGCPSDPRAEVIALMKYMVNHNTAHANELATLAGRLREMGDATACDQVLQAVSDFEKGNMRLSTVLAAMQMPE